MMLYKMFDAPPPLRSGRRVNWAGLFQLGLLVFVAVIAVVAVEFAPDAVRTVQIGDPGVVIRRFDAATGKFVLELKTDLDELTTIDADAVSAIAPVRENIISVNLPKATDIFGTLEIGGAFRGCFNLSSVSFPEATSIGVSAFTSCINLTSVSFPEATSIGGGAFGGCMNLTSVDFPKATSIGETAFTNCFNLTSVSFPEATSIGVSAFNGCTNLGENDPETTVIFKQGAWTGIDVSADVIGISGGRSEARVDGHKLRFTNGSSGFV